MKERPILFSAPMVRAILAGTKTQTRRVVKPQPPKGCTVGYYSTDNSKVKDWQVCDMDGDPADFAIRQPYGQPGDRLWVREHGYKFTGLNPDLNPKWRYFADQPTSLDNMPEYSVWAPVPSIHMPRWASRITLEVTEVRVQRLQEISEEDAAAEGCYIRTVSAPKSPECETWGEVRGGLSGIYSRLWDSINGAGSWDLNPWVWAISFRRIQP